MFPYGDDMMSYGHKFHNNLQWPIEKMKDEKEKLTNQIREIK